MGAGGSARLASGRALGRDAAGLDVVQRQADGVVFDVGDGVQQGGAAFQGAVAATRQGPGVHQRGPGRAAWVVAVAAGLALGLQAVLAAVLMPLLARWMPLH